MGVSTNRNFSVRRLSPGDTHYLRDLNQLYADAFDDPESYANHRPSDIYLQSLLGLSHVIVLVATDGRTRVVGGLTAYLLPKPEQERSELYIYDLAVAADARRSGVATELIRTADSIGKEQSSHVTYVQADYGDEPAINLYSKLGRKEEVLHFDLTKIRSGVNEPA